MPKLSSRTQTHKTMMDNTKYSPVGPTNKSQIWERTQSAWSNMLILAAPRSQVGNPQNCGEHMPTFTTGPCKIEWGLNREWKWSRTLQGQREAGILLTGCLLEPWILEIINLGASSEFRKDISAHSKAIRIVTEGSNKRIWS